jgi:excisionase family DNA binding protein
LPALRVTGVPLWRWSVFDPAPDVVPRMLNVKGAAVYLGATVWFVRSLAWGGELPTLKFGKRLVFDRADLDAYIEKRKRDARV